MKNLFTLILVCLVAFGMNAQTSWTVDNNTDSGADFTNLQTAVDAASAGDTLHIHSSPTSYGTVNLNKEVYFLGSGHNPSANSDGNTANIGNIYLSGNCANTTFNGLVIGGISVSSPINNISNITLRNNKFTGQVSGSNNPNVLDWLVEGNLFQNGAYIDAQHSYNWLIRNNYFYATWYIFYNVDASCTLVNNLIVCANDLLFTNCNNPTINNNIFYVTGSSTGIGFNNTSITASNNLTYAGNGITLPDFPGTDNLNNVDPDFTGADNSSISYWYSADYHPDTESPLVDAATDGGDIGIYGGNFGYSQDGKASNFPIMLNLDIQNPSVEAGQLLNVIFSAQKNQ